MCTQIKISAKKNPEADSCGTGKDQIFVCELPNSTYQNVLCLACFLLNVSGICYSLYVKILDFTKDPIFFGVITFLSTYRSQRL